MGPVEFKEMPQIIPNILFMFRILWTFECVNKWVVKENCRSRHNYNPLSWGPTITLPSSWAVATVTISLYKYFLIALPHSLLWIRRKVKRSTEGDIISLCPFPMSRAMRDVSYEIVMKLLFATHCVRMPNKWPADNISIMLITPENCSNNLVMILAPGQSSELNTDTRASDWSAQPNTGLWLADRVTKHTGRHLGQCQGWELLSVRWDDRSEETGASVRMCRPVTGHQAAATGTQITLMSFIKT